MLPPADASSARLPQWLSGAPGRWVIAVRAQPGARRTEAVGEHDGALKVRVAAPPIEGRANTELLRWIADRLGVALREVELAAGASGRNKRVRVGAPIPAVDLVERLKSR